MGEIKLFGQKIVLQQQQQQPKVEELNKNNNKTKEEQDQDNQEEEEEEEEDESNINNATTIHKRPDKIIPCPRCKSMDTKFCYFNNYNVNQPRHYCKGCQRYWTAGGALRNVPVGAGRRKAKPACLFDGLTMGMGMGMGMGNYELNGMVVDEWHQLAAAAVAVSGGGGGGGGRGGGGWGHDLMFKRRKSESTS